MAQLTSTWQKKVLYTCSTTKECSRKLPHYEKKSIQLITIHT